MLEHHISLTNNSYSSIQEGWGGLGGVGWARSDAHGYTSDGYMKVGTQINKLILKVNYEWLDG